MKTTQALESHNTFLTAIYEVCPDNFRIITIKKQLQLRHFVFLAFVNMAASDLHALQADSYYHQSASVKFAALLFLVPPSQLF
jgi:hypothetical protein